MRHVEKAKAKLIESGNTNAPYIMLEHTEDVKGLPSVISFIVQSDPIGEVGINGCQAVDILEYVKYLFESLNEAFPCNENEQTIAHLTQALDWQKARTLDRENRQVEGQNLL